MLGPVSEQIADYLLEVFEKVIADRRSYFLENPDKIPFRSAVTEIIEDYSTKNALLVGALNLIPGPLGLVTLPTEIVTVIYNQVAMIYDLGVAYGQQERLTQELLLGVLLSAMGTGAANVLVAQGSAYVVHRLSSDAIEHLIRTVLAKEIAETLGKSVAGKFLPVVGAVAIGAYVSYTTQRIGKQAMAIFQHEILVSGFVERADLRDWGTEGADLWETGEEVWQELERSAGVSTDLSGSGSVQPKIGATVRGTAPIPPPPPLVPPVVIVAELVEEEPSQERDSQGFSRSHAAYEPSYDRYESEILPLAVNLGLESFNSWPTDEQAWQDLEASGTPMATTADFEKLKCLINLMKSDGLVQEAEKTFLKDVLAKSDLSREQLQTLQAGLKSTTPLPVVYGPFRESWRDRMGLLMDLLALAKRDGQVHPTEKAYILEVSHHIGLQKGEITALLRQNI